MTRTRFESKNQQRPNDEGRIMFFCAIHFPSVPTVLSFIEFPIVVLESCSGQESEDELTQVRLLYASLRLHKKATNK